MTILKVILESKNPLGSVHGYVTSGTDHKSGVIVIQEVYKICYNSLEYTLCIK